MSEAVASTDDPRLEAYLRARLQSARRRGRRRAVLGAAVAVIVGLAGSLLAGAARDPEAVVEQLPLHTGRAVQGSVVRSLRAGAPSSARMAQRQIDRVPSEINSAVRQELERWVTRSAGGLADRVPDDLRELAADDSDALAEAMGIGPGQFDGADGADAAGKARAARLRAYASARLRPYMAEDLVGLDAGPIAYLVATANAVEELGQDAPSAEQLLEHLMLGLLVQLIAPA